MLFPLTTPLPSVRPTLKQRWRARRQRSDTAAWEAALRRGALEDLRSVLAAGWDPDVPARLDGH